MEQVVKHMTHWLLKKHLIVPEQSEWCHYMLMQSTMSILSLCLLLPVSAAIVGIMGVCVLYSNIPYLASTHRRLSCSYTAWMPFGFIRVAGSVFVTCSSNKGSLRFDNGYSFVRSSNFSIGTSKPSRVAFKRQRIESGKTQNVCASSHCVFGLCCSATDASGMVASCIAMATFAVAVLLAVAHVDDGEIHRFKKEHVNQKEVIQTMNEKESMMHKATRKALDVMIRRTYDGWPPNSFAEFTSPTAPKSPCPNRRKRSKQ